MKITWVNVFKTHVYKDGLEEFVLAFFEDGKRFPSLEQHIYLPSQAVADELERVLNANL